jgi:hypothetical protein
VARVLAISADLLLGSRVEAMLGAAGHEVSLHASLGDAPLEGAELVVADLDTEGPKALSGFDIPVIGFYSHVDAATRAAAQEAGLDLVVPRSRMTRELPQLVERLLEGGSG